MKKINKIFIVLMLALTLCGCSKEHEHEFEEKYTINDTHHYFECKSDECEEKKEYEKHTFDEGVVTEEETKEITTYTCIKCEYQYTVEKEIHKHSNSNNKKLYDNTKHYDECSCGEKLNVENHQMGEWVIDIEPTEENVGKKHQTCKVCEYTIEEEIPKTIHQHEAGTKVYSDETNHWYECSCGEKLNTKKHTFDDGYVKIPATPDTNGKIVYECTICKYQKEEESSKIEVRYLDVNRYNELDNDLGIKLFKYQKEIENNKQYYKVLLEEIGNYYKVMKIIDSGIELTGWYDYILMVSPKDLTGEYDKLVYYLNVEDYIIFDNDLSSLSKGKIDISLFKTTAPETIKVEYDLGYEQFDTKEDLYNAYFTEFYNFLKTKTDCDLESLNINNVDDFLRECLNWNFNSGNSFQGVGNAFSKYYLTIKVGDTLDNQPTDTFIGYCYQNNKFKDFIEHLEVFFAYWRTDEGYTNSTNNGNDFFASAWAALVDTCKFFYFTSENITDTYSWFTKERSPRVHYMLDNIPGVGRVYLEKESLELIYLPTLTRMNYKFLGWYNDLGKRIYTISSSEKVTAKWERIEYSVELYLAGTKKEYKVKSGLRLTVPSLNMSNYNIKKYVDEEGETLDIWNAITEDEKIFVILSSNNKKIYNLFLDFNEGVEEEYKYVLEEGEEYVLPIPKKTGYDFEGWYLTEDFSNNKYTSVIADSDMILYAKWVKSVDDDTNNDSGEEITENEVLGYISDVVTSDTIDNLPTNINGVNVTYTSSDNKLYTISKGIGYTSRRYQTHWRQKVTVYANLSNGLKYSKEITINPVTYDNMNHPKAVYFSVSSANSYKKYSERYMKEQTLFSDKFKSNMNMVYYAFAIPQENGTLTLNTTYLEEILELKNHGIRVLMVIDGANSAPLKAMVKLCDNASTRATFVKNILDLVKTHNFDGVDVDWEFPGILSSQAGYEKYTTAVDIKNLNSLLKELREGFNSLQDTGGSNYILSVATPPTDWGTDRFDYKTINQYCDYVNMMSYDLNKSNVTSHLAHIYQPSNSYSYKFCCDFGVSYYTSLGLDKSKIILGAAAYGKAYKVSGSTPNSKLPGLGMSGTLGQVSGFGLAGQSITWNSGTIYYTGIQTLINSGKFTQYNEYNNSGKLVGSYLYNASDKYFITFDSVLSVVEKCKYASNNIGMGIMVWAYGEDATDTIVNTICDNL